MCQSRPLSYVVFALVIASIGTLAARASAAAPSLDLLAPGELVWCGDQEGGGPYVYPADDDPNRVVGFEVELAQKLARTSAAARRSSRGSGTRCRSSCAPGNATSCSTATNGLRRASTTMDGTIPYYVYGLQLLARDDGDLTTWDDLERRDSRETKGGRAHRFGRREVPDDAPR